MPEFDFLPAFLSRAGILQGLSGENTASAARMIFSRTTGTARLADSAKARTTFAGRIKGRFSTVFPYCKSLADVT
ncbi:hypothetical protein [Bacteroides gallinarum]|uniref:hypothetical protein n=1 Tax=Bacteroides gallinarum TaxID=376806 RepID=UPI001427DE5D|nr:hypothetical protein [Bacteroides gallinarum]